MNYEFLDDSYSALKEEEDDILTNDDREVLATEKNTLIAKQFRDCNFLKDKSIFSCILILPMRSNKIILLTSWPRKRGLSYLVIRSVEL